MIGYKTRLFLILWTVGIVGVLSFLRSLGGLTQIEPASIKYLIENDRTAVFIDARDAAAFRKGTVPGAKNLPRALLTPGKDTGEVKAAKDDGRLPMEDHNTRIVVFGDNSGQAIAVAEAIMNEAFHNVMFFGGSYDQFKAASER